MNNYEYKNDNPSVYPNGYVKELPDINEITYDERILDEKIISLKKYSWIGTQPEEGKVLVEGKDFELVYQENIGGSNKLWVSCSKEYFEICKSAESNKRIVAISLLTDSKEEKKCGHEHYRYYQGSVVGSLMKCEDCNHVFHSSEIKEEKETAVNRIEVIDETGRAYVKYFDGTHELSYQDKGRTLKIFINPRK